MARRSVRRGVPTGDGHTTDGGVTVDLVQDAFRHMRQPEVLGGMPALVDLANRTLSGESGDAGHPVQVLLERAIAAVGYSSLRVLDRGPDYFSAILNEVYAEGQAQKDVFPRYGVRSDTTFSVHLRRACEEATRYLQRLQAGGETDAAAYDLPGGEGRARDLAPRPLELPLTSFVGRERELAILGGYFAGAGVTRGRPPCLITLTGPPGVGKSRLAVRAAHAARPRFDGGVCWVSLAPVPDTSLLLAAIAKELRIGNDPVSVTADLLAQRIGDRKLLLVLDDFDHLRRGIPTVVQLLRACRQLVVLVTGREALRAEGEHVVEVRPLPIRSLPAEAPGASGSGPRTDDEDHQDAIRLFLDRARAVDAHFVATPADLRDVARLCRRLDGLPLAIELVAANCRGRTPAQLLQSQDQFLCMRSPYRTEPVWHLTLQEAIAWSYDMLRPAEQRLFRRCAIFAGSFSLAAAEEVCTDASAERAAASALLGVLEDKHLLREERGGAAEPRYSLLATIQRYAWDRLREHQGELQAIQARHATYFLEWARRVAAATLGSGQITALSSIDLELGNLRAVLNRSLKTRAASTGLALAGDLWPFWLLRGHLREGRDWLAGFLDLAARVPAHVPEAARAKALFAAGFLAVEDQAADAYFAEARSRWQALGDRWGEGWCLLGQGLAAIARPDHAAAHDCLLAARRCFGPADVGEGKAGAGWALSILGRLAHLRGDDAAARRYLEAARTLWEEVGDAWGRGTALSHLANLRYLDGRCAEAAACYEECVRLFRDLGFRAGLAWRLNALGDVRRILGQRDLAQAAYEESRRLFEELHIAEGVAWTLHNLAYLAPPSGDPTAAADLLGPSLTTFQALNHRPGIIACIVALAGVAAAAGRPYQAARLLGAADAAMPSQRTLEPADRAEYVRIVAVVRAQLSEDQWMAATQDGAAGGLDQAIALALSEGIPT